MKKKNLVALLALLALTLSTALTGCGQGGKSSQTTATLDKEHMYKSEFVKTKNALSYINTMLVTGDNLYVSGYLEEVNGGTNGNVLLQINIESQEETVLKLPLRENGNLYSSMSATPDGNICYLENVYTWNEEKPEESKDQYFFRIASPDMEEVANIEMTDFGGEFYPDRMLVDGEGNIYISDYQTLRVYDKDGKKINEMTANGISSMFLNNKGEVLVCSYNESYTKMDLKKVDLETKELKDLGKSWDSYATGYRFISGDDKYPMYMTDGKDLFGYNPETDEQTLILNWVNCDVNGSSISDFSIASNGKILCNGYNELSSKQEVMMLTKIDPSQVKDKKILTLASVYDDYSMKNVVIAFNRKSEDYRIVLKDYSQYVTEDNYNAGAEQFNNDLISGIVPDIINLQQLNVNNYISKGLLEDLYPFMEQDKEIKREDYLENIFTALEVDGKLYEMIPSFYAYSVIAKTENVGEEPGWTMDDMEATLAKMPEGAKSFHEMSRESALEFGYYLASEQFVDYKAGTCSYDSEAFKKLLEFANQFPSNEELYKDAEVYAEAEVSNEESDKANLFRKNKVLMEMMYLYDYEQFHSTKYGTFGGEDLTFIGFPTENKNGSALVPQIELAVSSTSANKEGAWEFVKFFLSDDYQGTVNFGFPIKKSQLEKKKEEAQKVPTYTDENGKEVEIENTMYIDGKEVNIGQISDADVKKVNDFLGSISQILRSDSKIANILGEETKAYFEGQKSADEVAKLIQNRVQTYLSETR